MNKQSEALRLADTLERMSLSTPWDKKAAAELRRLHALNAELLEALKEIKLKAGEPEQVYHMTKAAIAKAQGESNE